MQLILGLVVVIAIILLIGWLQDNKEKRRVTSLREAAERLGFDFRKDEDAGVLRQTIPFLIFYQGVSSTAHNVMLSPTPQTTRHLASPPSVRLQRPLRTVHPELAPDRHPAPLADPLPA